MHCILLFLFVAIVSVLNIINGTPLDDYVNKPDPTFGWKLLKTHEAITHTRYVLNMTSQSWFNCIHSAKKTTIH